MGRSIAPKGRAILASDERRLARDGRQVREPLWLGRAADCRELLRQRADRDPAHGLRAHLNLRGPIVDESTSALVLIMLLPILKRSVDAFSSVHDRRMAFIFVTMAVIAYALLHIVLIVLLRQMATRLSAGLMNSAGGRIFPTEFRKDLISAFMIVVVFWLIDRRPGARSVATADELPAPPPRASLSLRPEIWLRDGSASIRVDPTEVISVTSAGNYVEFVLPARRHLIRGTLAAEETRLKPFGFSRVHRTKLVNTYRIAIIEPRPNGDFALRMDNGEVIAGSRRYKDAIVAIRAADRHKKNDRAYNAACGTGPGVLRSICRADRGALFRCLSAIRSAAEPVSVCVRN